MKKVSVYNSQAEKVKDMDLNPAVFGVEVKDAVVHQVAVAYMANVREAIAHTKTRGEVRGGGKKPWRQKGTGRARHGSSRSPIWVGGGVTFGPRNERNFSQKINKKVKDKALSMCLSDKVEQAQMLILDKLELTEGKSKELVEIIKNFKDVLKLDKKTKKVKFQKEDKKEDNKENKNFDIKDYKVSTLLVVDENDTKIFRAGKNLTGLKVKTSDRVCVLDVLKYKKLLMTEKAVEKIENRLLKNKVEVKQDK